MQETITIASRNFPADTAILAELRQFVGEVLSHLNLNAEALRNLELAVDEAAANVIEHAAKIFPCQIGYSCSTSPNHQLVICEISWESDTPFQPEAPAQSDILERIHTKTPGGLGLFLMHQLVDDIEFDYQSGRCYVRLSKNV